MKSHVQVAVIGGGVVGASVLYHLTKFGWTDVLLIERKELTAGSTWHAAAGFHAINGDPNVAALQRYTIELYKEIEEESGQAVGLHMPGGIQIAATPERWEFLKAAWALNHVLGLESHLLTPEEIKAKVPIMDTSDVLGGLYDNREGHLDPYGTTHAYATAARKKGATVVTNNRVLELHAQPDGHWQLVTEQGTFTAEHVVNAGGLWADRIGRMAGVTLPVAALEHHYLITEGLPSLQGRAEELPMVVDLDGFTYMRQEHDGVLLGVYELNTKHWNVDGVPWDFGIELIPEDIDRIAPQLMVGFERYPEVQEAGIKKWINGAFTFTPDGNPLVGPVPGLKNFWCACGVMAGFSQGGGVGLALAEWMTEGEMTRDILGMDVARYFPEAASRPYLLAKTGEFYARRFNMNYPNEVWPAARPLKTSPLYDQHKAKGAVFGVSYGLEYPLWFADSPEAAQETPTFRRSNAFGPVGREVEAVRQGVGLIETATFSKYEVTGPGAAAWLDRLLACRLPPVGRVRLAPMLGTKGQLMGDLTLARLAEDRFLLMGSGYLQAWHMRWFNDHLPSTGGVTVRNLSEAWLGLALAGPKSRDVLAALANGANVSNDALRFMAVQEMDIGWAPAVVGRLSVTGELGYEIHVPAAYQRGLHAALMAAGQAHGIREVGLSALNSLRLEKSYGIWSKEFTTDYTPKASGLDAFVAYDKPDFIGREAALADRDGTPPRRLVTLAIDSPDADAFGFEPVWLGDQMIGHTTSGGYGHHVGLSLAMAYVDSAALDGPLSDDPAVEVHIVGERCSARLLRDAAHDPQGLRPRM